MSIILTLTLCAITGLAIGSFVALLLREYWKKRESEKDHEVISVIVIWVEKDEV